MLATLLLLSSAIPVISNAHASPADFVDLSAFTGEQILPLTDARVKRFQGDLEKIEDLRVETKRLFNHLQPIVSAVPPQPLSGDDLEAMDLITKQHSFYASELDVFIHFGKRHQTEASMDRESALDISLELAATLVFTDSVDQVVTIFENSPELRKILDRSNPTFGRSTDVLYTAMQNYYSIPHYDRRAGLIEWFSNAKDFPQFESSPELKYMKKVILASGAYKHYVEGSALDHFKERAEMETDRLAVQASKTRDRTEDFFTHQMVGAVSKAFGNAVGSIQFRHGKLFQDKSIAAQMKAVLKPGDLLLEATPFRATSYFIPGHYGHVAMWVGTESELQDLGLWNTPEFAHYQAAIHAGGSILEALRSGVELNPVEHFLDIDDLLILRPNSDISAAQIKEAIELGMTHVGQAYDFNFDNDTNDKIVCSELALSTYTSVHFRQDRTLGRWTINPDDVAEQGLRGKAFTPVMIVVDGKVKTGDLQAALAAALASSKKK
jgi:uncharacterized protein YycO